MNLNMHKDKKIVLDNSIYSDDLAFHNWSRINKDTSCRPVRSDNSILKSINNYEGGSLIDNYDIDHQKQKRQNRQE